jgi:hypothetical protein
MATQEWIKELTRTNPNWGSQPVSTVQIGAAMKAAGVNRDAMVSELNSWREDNPHVFVVNPSRVTLATLATMIDNPARIKQTWALLNAAQQAELTKQLKAAESPQPVSVGTAAAATPAASVPVKVTAQTRPYRLKIDNTVKSYQLVSNVWHEVTIGTDQTLQVGAAVKPYMIATLNALKKKVDAQRAAGNLTDSRISVKSAILESMHALLRESR